jgi:predicted AlkP superfamily pyrophosphatase or phosphodiesterase
MRYQFKLGILVLTIFWHLNIQTAHAKIAFYGRNRSKNQRVLLVSFDGFRYDYIERYGLSNFRLFIERDRASRAAYLNPQFTTQTFPNHWSVVTGAYVETHGIVANSFYDPKLGEHFSRENDDYADLKWWNSTEPVWFAVVREFKKAGAYFWPGADALFLNETRRKNYYRRVDFNKNITFQDKV